MTDPGAAQQQTVLKTITDLRVIGAATAGTDALRRRETPFGRDRLKVRFTTTDEAFSDPAEPAPVWDEIAPIPLGNPSAPRRIKGPDPQARLIAILNKPVRSIFSGYAMQIRSERKNREMHAAFGPDHASPRHDRHTLGTHPRSKLFTSLIGSRLTRDVLRLALHGRGRHLMRRTKKGNLGQALKILFEFHANLLRIYRNGILRPQDPTRLDLFA